MAASGVGPLADDRYDRLRAECLQKCSINMVFLRNLFPLNHLQISFTGLFLDYIIPLRPGGNDPAKDGIVSYRKEECCWIFPS
jgi:hypothetical protein